VFPYSARSGTPAAKMPQVKLAARKERAARLREAGALQLQKFLQNCVGKELNIVIEQNGNSGHSEGFALVRTGQSYAPGSIQKVKIVSANACELFGA
jgi:threonylcarbamoyladenosine tRNA methylthiotransferase MtaB